MPSIEAKRWIVAALGMLFLASLLVVAYREARREGRPGQRPRPVVDRESRECVECHGKVTPGIVRQWEDSRHALRGIGCVGCHGAAAGDKDGFEHHAVRISTIVSPLDCSRCHEKEYKEQLGSRHAEAAAIGGPLDLLLGSVSQGGGPVVSLGCQGCHGGTVKVQESGKLDPKTWPDRGIGRINPDGSKGSCSACHHRHDFSLAVARSPEACGKCHSGAKGPDLEIYNGSKHGVRFQAFHDQMNLEARPWVVGRDYHAAPTCATCHLSATPTQPTTHDVGSRLSWTLGPVLSARRPEADARRDRMLDVCGQCHSDAWGTSYFDQFDGYVKLYNEQYAAPAKTIMDALYAAKVLTPEPLDEPIEFTFFELWHQHGRRGRHGASMMGPDFAWHGAYEMAKSFSTRLVPEAERLKPGVTIPILGRNKGRVP